MVEHLIALYGHRVVLGCDVTQKRQQRAPRSVHWFGRRAGVLAVGQCGIVSDYVPLVKYGLFSRRQTVAERQGDGIRRTTGQTAANCFSPVLTVKIHDVIGNLIGFAKLTEIGRDNNFCAGTQCHNGPPL